MLIRALKELSNLRTIIVVGMGGPTRMVKSKNELYRV